MNMEPPEDDVNATIKYIMILALVYLLVLVAIALFMFCS